MFYKELDQKWINNKIDEYEIDIENIKDEIKGFGCSLSDVLESPNLIITIIMDLIIRQLIEKLEDYKISGKLKDQIQESLQESTVVNSICSSIDTSGVFENYQDEILQELKKLKKAKMLEEIKSLFSKYDF